MPTYATHEEISIDAQNPNHTCLLNMLYVTESLNLTVT